MLDLYSWIPLTDYSLKHKVSVSTLRRRIKADDIKFKLEDGKYFLLDEPLNTHQREHRPSLNSETTLMRNSVILGLASDAQKEAASSQLTATPQVANLGAAAYAVKKDDELISSTNKLLTELKKAYSLVLQEKEEQILELKEETADLKTLIKILEGENLRLRDQMNHINQANQAQQIRR